MLCWSSKCAVYVRNEYCKNIQIWIKYWCLIQNIKCSLEGLVSPEFAICTCELTCYWFSTPSRQTKTHRYMYHVIDIYTWNLATCQREPCDRYLYMEFGNMPKGTMKVGATKSQKLYRYCHFVWKRNLWMYKKWNERIYTLGIGCASIGPLLGSAN